MKFLISIVFALVLKDTPSTLPNLKSNLEFFIKSLETYMGGYMLFFALNKFVRHYVPFIRGKANSLLKNRDNLFNLLYNIIKQRRIEIENTPLDQPLRHDMLTSFVIAYTPRDIKNDDAESSRPMTDDEILANLIDSLIAGTDTVSKKKKKFFFF